ncbi:ATP-binding protein [Aquimarina algicola]|uniref:histidine kinase n=1 Tax=Aquimarina algicola TaxID=2589995 RepID=A0A504J7C2_9FLAO|nr:ATP-binding protein [Aquimarina algicola]TPN84505.1 GAF domain-containing protein [Aquimarina algicola]
MPVNEDNYKENYLSFSLTADNCGEEPIHRPIVIHNHGAILAWDKDNPNIPVFISDNITSVSPKFKVEEYFNLFSKDWMVKDMYHAFEEMEDPFSWNSIDPVPIHIEGKPWNIIRHIHGNTRFIELEPVYSEKNLLGRKLSSFHEIRMVTEPLQYIDNIPELFRVFTEKYRQVTGYDRVMIYRFDEDFHGSVEGESKKDEIESFFGLHYPATDIPPVARELFLKNRSRIIPDVNAKTSKVIFNPKVKKPMDYLDLTYTQLRGTSPIHIEYLQNMQVQATYTLALIIDNKLWGLIACHHYSPFFLNYETRKTGELIADNLCRRISEIQFAKEQKKRIRFRKKEEDFNKHLVSSWEVLLQLINNKIDLVDLLEVDGAAIITSSLGIYHQGLAPEKDTLLKIYGCFEKNPDLFENDVCITKDIRSLLENKINLKDLSEEIGGAAIIQLKELDNCMIVWFKKSERTIHEWAGDPRRPYEINYSKNGDIRLSPRKSFEKWKNEVNFKCSPWDIVSVEMIKRIKDIIIKRNRDWNPFQSEHYKRELEQITYTASHDLQEPLRTIDNYLMLIDEELEVKDSSFNEYLDKTRSSAKRMSKLIDQMLVYSKVGSSGRMRENTDINIVINQIKEDFNLKIDELKAVINCKELPIIYCDPIDIKKLFQNLISNSLKYSKANIPPLIEIYAEETSSGWMFSVTDNGIGIDKKNFEKVFSLFQRLHHQDDIPGTGIGLPTCRKIVESMNGRIWLTSEVGVGSTFWFTLKSEQLNHKLKNKKYV